MQRNSDFLQRILFEIFFYFRFNYRPLYSCVILYIIPNLHKREICILIFMCNFPYYSKQTQGQNVKWLTSSDMYALHAPWQQIAI